MRVLVRWSVLPLVLFGTMACSTQPHRTEASILARFFLESREGGGGTATLPRSGTQITVGLKPVITEFDLVDVQVARVELGDCLLFSLSPAAARDMYRLTAANQGSRLVLVLNGEPLGARRIDQPFEDGSILIFVEISDGALQSLAKHLRASIHELRQESRNL